MIDANSQFFAILTNVGMAKQANADALGVAWKITEMGVGDANPTGIENPPNPVPSASQTKLINEWRRRPLNQLRIDPVNSAVIIAEQIIPADEGGRWIRELGLYDSDGDLVAVANCAPSFKPLLSQGSGRTQVVRMNMVVTSNASITLKIDPSVVLATREFVETRILEELDKLDRKQSVRAATTANIALTGLQVVDGVSLNAGDRVLVKNQAAAKDNGPYVVAVGAWTRAKDADNSAKVTPNLTVAVEVGATQADTIWQLVTDGTIVVGTTPLTFQDITAGLARLLSPSFAGNPTAPTPVQFDASKSIPTTEFLKRRGVEFSGFTTNSASLVLTATHVGGLHSFSSAAQLMATLPPTLGVAQGATITLVCAGVGGLNVVAAAGDVVYTSTGITGPLLLALGDTAEFIRLQDQWRLVGGSVLLRFAGTMSGPHFVTQPLFDNSKAFATTEFVQKALNGYASFQVISASRNLALTDMGALLWFNSVGSYSLNLLAPSVMGVPTTGVSFTVFCTSVGGTVTASGGATIQDQSGGLNTTYAMKLGQSAKFVATGPYQWTVLESTASLAKNADFAAVLAATAASQQLPGLMIKVGSIANGSTSATIPLTFPVSFPNVCVALVLSPWQTGGGAYSHNGRDKSGATISRGANPAFYFDYIAIGY